MKITKSDCLIPGIIVATAGIIPAILSFCLGENTVAVTCLALALGGLASSLITLFDQN